MQKYLKFILIITTIAAIFAIVLLIVGNENTQENPDEHLIKIEGLEREKWPRKITTENINGFLVAKNVFDKYQITLPQNWSINSVATPEGGFVAVHTNQETDDNATINILTNENAENVFVKNFINSPAFKFNNLAFKKIFINNYPVYLSEQSGQSYYVFGTWEKFYTIICEGDTQQMLSLCENQIKTFQILPSTYNQAFIINNPLIQLLPHQSDKFDVYLYNTTGNNAQYLLYLKPVVIEPGEGAHNFAVRQAEEEALNWIRQQGINPDNLNLRFTTTDPEYYVPQ